METQLEVARAPRKLPKIGRRTVVIASALLLIAAAVVLNFVLYQNGVLTGKETPGETPVDAGEEANTETVSADGYFSATQVSRQRARDEALEVLQSVVENENADEATKTEALLEISDLARAMEQEANIETLVRAKGFERCVAVINGESCSVVVSGEKLQQNQISQINEIVYEQSGIKPANIRIVTR